MFQFVKRSCVPTIGRWTSNCSSFSKPLLSKAHSHVQDTVYALCSGLAMKSGVAVIRMSGPLSATCLQSLLGPNQYSKFSFAPRKASLRKLYCPASGKMIDEGLILWFPGPHSFTGEDVVEFHLHGSRAVIHGIFQAFEAIGLNNRQTGGTAACIRPAERGEFTMRAFDHGRLSLTEVEGLADLLDAETSEQRVQALRQMDGHMKRQFDECREMLVQCLAHMEVVIYSICLFALLDLVYIVVGCD